MKKSFYIEISFYDMNWIRSNFLFQISFAFLIFLFLNWAFWNQIEKQNMTKFKRMKLISKKKIILFSGRRSSEWIEFNET